MAQLVLLVVAAAWAAVLVPPMLRSRVENHPNSSVTDFRRQLSTLQSTSTSTRGALRAMGRPLMQSPLQRPAAGGRPAHALHRQASVYHGPTAPSTSPGARAAQRLPEAPAGQPYRSHGDPTGGQHGPHRQMHMARPHDQRGAVRRRRSNVLFILVVLTACSLFLAATTGSSVVLYLFALAFLALCGYVYLLAQIRQREQTGGHDGPVGYR